MEDKASAAIAADLRHFNSLLRAKAKRRHTR
jgi:hypothetical protein